MEASASHQARGALLGLTAAALFGMSAPIAKLLLPATDPLVLAGLLYAGGGLGLVIFGALRKVTRRTSAEARPARADFPVLAALIVLGGILGPFLMLVGLQRISGVAGSLLLNLEGPLTVAIALLFFREHLGTKGIFAVVAVFAGASLLAFRSETVRLDWMGVLAIAGACLCWALDNNLTQRLSLKDPVAIVRIKAVCAGSATLLIAYVAGQKFPPLPQLAAAAFLGSASYGVSIVLDMYALRLVGAAREAAYFATGPFIGAIVSVPLLGETFRTADVAASLCMVAGVIALLRERHGHHHAHESIEHEHLHVHDEHHQHMHERPVTEPHSHWHQHAALTHDHPHVSDLHHRHRH